MFGAHCIKTLARNQSLVARSSAEAELYSAVEASSEALGCQILMMEFGQDKKGSSLHRFICC